MKMPMPKRETRIRILKAMEIIAVLFLLAAIFLFMLGVSMMDSESLIYPFSILGASTISFAIFLGLGYLLTV